MRLWPPVCIRCHEIEQIEEEASLRCDQSTGSPNHTLQVAQTYLALEVSSAGNPSQAVPLLARFATLSPRILLQQSAAGGRLWMTKANELEDVMHIKRVSIAILSEYRSRLEHQTTHFNLFIPEAGIWVHSPTQHVSPN